VAYAVAMDVDGEIGKNDWWWNGVVQWLESIGSSRVHICFQFCYPLAIHSHNPFFTCFDFGISFVAGICAGLRAFLFSFRYPYFSLRFL